jgi:6-pyruvoyl-tetrahydropterin synthase
MRCGIFAIEEALNRITNPNGVRTRSKVSFNKDEKRKALTDVHKVIINFDKPYLYENRSFIKKNPNHNFNPNDFLCFFINKLSLIMNDVTIKNFNTYNNTKIVYDKAEVEFIRNAIKNKESKFETKLALRKFFNITTTLNKQMKEVRFYYSVNALLDLLNCDNVSYFFYDKGSKKIAYPFDYYFINKVLDRYDDEKPKKCRIDKVTVNNYYIFCDLIQKHLNNKRKLYKFLESNKESVKNDLFNIMIDLEKATEFSRLIKAYYLSQKKIRELVINLYHILATYFREKELSEV